MDREGLRKKYRVCLIIFFLRCSLNLYYTGPCPLIFYVKPETVHMNATICFPSI